MNKLSYFKIIQIDDSLWSLTLISVLYIILGVYTFGIGIWNQKADFTEQSIQIILHASALIFVINAGILGKQQQKSTKFPFGMQMLETLSAFAMTLYIMIVSISSFMKTIHHLLEDSNVLDHFHTETKNHTHTVIYFFHYLRFFLAMYGTFKFLKYSFFTGFDFKYIQRNEDYNHFVSNYNLIIAEINSKPFYDYHCVNMSSVFLFFLQELILVFGDFLEFFIEQVFISAWIEPSLTLMNIYLIWSITSPLLKATAYSLLVACEIDQDYSSLIQKLRKIDGVSNVDLKIWGSTSVNSKSALVSVQTEELVKEEQLYEIRQQTNQISQQYFSENIWTAINDEKNP